MTTESAKCWAWADGAHRWWWETFVVGDMAQIRCNCGATQPVATVSRLPTSSTARGTAPEDADSPTANDEFTCAACMGSRFLPMGTGAAPEPCPNCNGTGVVRWPKPSMSPAPEKLTVQAKPAVDSDADTRETTQAPGPRCVFSLGLCLTPSRCNEEQACRRCPSCPHPIHLGACTKRNGGTAYACGCGAQRPTGRPFSEGASPASDAPRGEARCDHDLATIQADAHGMGQVSGMEEAERIARGCADRYKASNAEHARSLANGALGAAMNIAIARDKCAPPRTPSAPPTSGTARERAHALVAQLPSQGPCRCGEPGITGSTKSCRLITALIEAHDAERDRLSAEVTRLQGRANMRFDEGTAFLVEWNRQVDEQRERALKAEADLARERTERAAVVRERDEVRGLLGRFVKYFHEDRAVTPGVTRLARLADEARRALAATETPGTTAPGKEGP